MSIFLTDKCLYSYLISPLLIRKEELWSLVSTKKGMERDTQKLQNLLNLKTWRWIIVFLHYYYSRLILSVKISSHIYYLQPADMSLEEIESRLGSLIQPDTISQLKSAVWKERLEGLLFSLNLL